MHMCMDTYGYISMALRDTIKKMKRQDTGREKIYASYTW